MKREKKKQNTMEVAVWAPAREEALNILCVCGLGCEEKKEKGQERRRKEKENYLKNTWA